MGIGYWDMQTLKELTTNYSPKVILVDLSAISSSFSVGENSSKKDQFKFNEVLPQYPIYVTKQVFNSRFGHISKMDLQTPNIPNYVADALTDMKLLKNKHILSFENHSSYKQVYDRVSYFDDQTHREFAQFSGFSELPAKRLSLDNVAKDVLTSAVLIADNLNELCILISNNIKMFRVMKKIKDDKFIRKFLTFWTRNGNGYFNKFKD